jgi:hypothetical protein
MGLEMAESGGRLHCKSEARQGRAHPLVVAQAIGGAHAHERDERADGAAKSTPHAGRGSAARRVTVNDVTPVRSDGASYTMRDRVHERARGTQAP